MQASFAYCSSTRVHPVECGLDGLEQMKRDETPGKKANPSPPCNYISGMNRDWDTTSCSCKFPFICEFDLKKENPNEPKREEEEDEEEEEEEDGRMPSQTEKDFPLKLITTNTYPSHSSRKNHSPTRPSTIQGVPPTLNDCLMANNCRKFTPTRSAQDVTASTLLTRNGSPETTEEELLHYNCMLRSEEGFTKVEKALACLDQLINTSSDLTLKAQVKASEVLLSLSLQLLLLQDKANSSSEGIDLMASSLFDAVDQLLEAMEWEPEANTYKRDMMATVTSNLIQSLDKIQDAFLAMIKEGDKPVILQGMKFSIYLSRNRSVDLSSSTVSTPGPGRVSFTFPSQHALKHVIDADASIQIKLAGFEFNPFSSIGDKQLTGNVGSLSLLDSNDSEVAVYNLSENMEINLFRNNVTEVFMSFTNPLTMELNVTSDEDTVVINIKPEKQCPLQLFLAFQYIPTETAFELHTALPILDDHGDNIYTWILTPGMLIHGVGVYYVMVTSPETAQAEAINYTVNVFATQCLFWQRQNWSTDQCQVKVTVLRDNDPLAQYGYLIKVHTGFRRGATTTAKVIILLSGSEGQSDPHHLTDPEKPVLERGGSDEFLLTTFFSLGNLQYIRLWHDNSGSSPSWYVNHVTVVDVKAGQQWYFICNSWLAVDIGENVLDKVFHAASDEELKHFQNVFFMKIAESLTDQHIWISVIERPARSPFTRVQRVSCCLSLLLGSMLTNIMFWGTSPDDSLQYTTLGELSIFMREFMIGIESAIIMFPINLGIVQIFRSLRPRETNALKAKNAQSSSSPSFSAHPLTPESLMQDIKQIINLVSSTVKDGVPALEEDISCAGDVNQLLVLMSNVLQMSVEQQTMRENEENPTALLKNQRPNLELSRLCTLLEQLEENLNQMSINAFKNPYSQMHAVDQMRKMTHFLKSTPRYKDSFSERVTTTTWEGLNKLSSRPDQEDKSKQRGFNGLPWWFVYIAWFFVMVTSATSAFFTMLYGLAYGKVQSIKWLISMATSLFQSMFILQPVKVLCTAAFIALFVRKVDHYDGEETFHLTTGTRANVLLANRNSKIYHPPPVQFVEHIKERKRKEKKMYARIQEILVHLVFLSLLLTVAYGEQNHNSFHLNSIINQTFAPSFSHIQSINDFYFWANTLLLPKLYGSYKGFLTDGYSKLLGSPRIQQLRVKQHACPALKVLKSFVKQCEVPYSYDEEDMSNYGERWTSNVSGQDSNLHYVWRYQSNLQQYPFWRKLALYRGSGYVVDLTTEMENASRIVKYLAESNWIDSYSRAVFVEFTVYNANVNLFCVIVQTLETNGMGAFTTSTDLESMQLSLNQDITILFSAVKVAYMLFIVYHMVLQVKLLKKQSWKYFMEKANLMELSIILCSWSGFALILKRILLERGTLDLYLKNPQSPMCCLAHTYRRMLHSSRQLYRCSVSS
ncbi:polycystin-1-like protein 2 isoform X2 [Narcine bancroftii]|uniref:polycystin-1-like protein 2 isoform X2 n=1 Tax=Narcine bancroftii TaxID=1343680 RepID=UPI0038321F80